MSASSSKPLSRVGDTTQEAGSFADLDEIVQNLSEGAKKAIADWGKFVGNASPEDYRQVTRELKDCGLHHTYTLSEIGHVVAWYLKNPPSEHSPLARPILRFLSDHETCRAGDVCDRFFIRPCEIEGEFQRLANAGWITRDGDNVAITQAGRNTLGCRVKEPELSDEAKERLRFIADHKPPSVNDLSWWHSRVLKKGSVATAFPLRDRGFIQFTAPDANDLTITPKGLAAIGREPERDLLAELAATKQSCNLFLRHGSWVCVHVNQYHYGDTAQKAVIAALDAWRARK